MICHYINCEKEAVFNGYCYEHWKEIENIPDNVLEEWSFDPVFLHQQQEINDLNAARK